eukprot:975723-Pyramimonas_sp.AAC.1
MTPVRGSTPVSPPAQDVLSGVAALEGLSRGRCARLGPQADATADSPRVGRTGWRGQSITH